jgi:DNA-binding transcriptional ArsR family regulator/DNA-directed RNA polymerase subunit M/transcription elongation factor TFIIS
MSVQPSNEYMPSEERPGERDKYVREAFQLLADDTRLDIIEHLRHAEDSPVSYTEIKSELGVRDSGRFNYHLDKLTGTFITKSEEGYALSFSANTLYQAILSTRPIAEHPSPTFDVAKSCPECGSILEIRYETEFIISQCPNCETQSFGYPFPAGGFEGRTDKEALQAVVQRMYHHVSLAQQGVCPYCSGKMTAEWLTDHNTEFSSDMLVHYTCSLCEMELHTSVVGMVEQHSAVVSLFDDYDLDLREMMPWEFRSYAPTEDVTIRSKEPLEIEVPVTIDGDEFTVHVGENMEIADIES